MFFNCYYRDNMHIAPTEKFGSQGRKFCGKTDKKQRIFT